MPPGFYAPTTSTPSTRLKTMKGAPRPSPAAAPAAGMKPTGGVPTSPAFAQPTPTPARQNPTTMSTWGGSTQQTDQMGRVITTTPGAVDHWGRQLGGGSTVIEDPDLIRRSRDLADEQTRAARPRAAAPPEAGSPRITGPIPWDEVKPDAVPREPGFAAPPREVGKGPEDRTAAESAAFARAGERIARIGKGNLSALRSQMTRRGISGSGVEKSLVTENANSTAGLLGEVVRDQAIEGLRREQEIDDRDLQAGIAQRGQDIGVGSTNYSGNISQRGQDVGLADWRINALPSILALMRMRGGAA